jgi:biotin---protein ligase
VTGTFCRDQRVTLTTVDPPRPVRIVGITPDYGLLRTVPERSGLSGGNVGHVGLGTATQFSRYVYPGGEQREYIDLQPDGNSFDLMAGLIKAKTT